MKKEIPKKIDADILKMSERERYLRCAKGYLHAVWLRHIVVVQDFWSVDSSFFNYVCLNQEDRYAAMHRFYEWYEKEWADGEGKLEVENWFMPDTISFGRLPNRPKAYYGHGSEEEKAVLQKLIAETDKKLEEYELKNGRKI